MTFLDWTNDFLEAFEIISLIQEKQEAAAELDESMEVVEGGEDRRGSSCICHKYDL